jgi:hypothetical protein
VQGKNQQQNLKVAVTNQKLPQQRKNKI